ncbi:hypothetical protein ElyMa_006496800 [Elysia marginata]|uniref:Uncharacterized protein n=1 Tax=Elysia marginata TaxID=1093978 RepID=A0AAV4I267_9GAST|nr:hypothetical protein ElyMa_006496800 [Elysia marginata]
MGGAKGAFHSPITTSGTLGEGRKQKLKASHLRYSEAIMREASGPQYHHGAAVKRVDDFRSADSCFADSRYRLQDGNA